MTKELFESLNALCEMWEYYLGDKSFYKNPVAENAKELLDKYELLDNEIFSRSKVDWVKLEKIKQRINL